MNAVSKYKNTENIKLSRFLRQSVNSDTLFTFYKLLNYNWQQLFNENRKNNLCFQLNAIQVWKLEHESFCRLKPKTNLNPEFKMAVV